MHVPKNNLSNKKHNWALKTGIATKAIPVFVLIFIAILYPEAFAEYEETQTDYFFGSKLTFLLSLIWMSFVAPVYEEVIFDGAFLKKKIWQIISYGGLIGFTLYFNRSMYSIGLLLLFFALSYFYFRKSKKSKSVQNSRIVVNALLFSAIHLDIPDIPTEIDWLFFVSLFSRFGGHLLSLWLVINYKLLYGILLHAIWNTALAIGTLFATDFQAQPGKLHQIENQFLKIEYQKAADFKEKHIQLSNPYHLKYRSVSVEEIYFWFPNRFAIEKEYEPKNKTSMYNFDIYVKDSSLVDKRIILHHQIIEMFVKDSLLIGQ